MKRILLSSLFIALLSLSVMAQQYPILVGHRGSAYGVENTEEAFRNGAKLGYQYVETDIKVTADTKFVLCHNDDLSSFGHSSLAIASSTLEQLQAVTLTQTRSSVKYTGKLMELGEFLDLCTELQILPVIELKWGTGVNSNDQSNMPALVKVIQDKGYYNKAIILTSMKPCLEWLNTNHPEIELQFLTGEYWASHFDWCVEKGIDVDIQRTYFDKTTVEKFHNAGLKVNMWTTNDGEEFKEHALWGCDFITTDHINGAFLPTLADVKGADFWPEVTTDYADPLKGSAIQPAAAYNFKQEYVDYAIPELAGKTLRRMVAHDNKYFILALDANNAPTIVVFDPVTKVVTPVSTEGITMPEKIAKANASRLMLCSDIQVSSDGYLLGVSLAETTDVKGGLATIYKWEKDANGLPTGNPAAWISTQAAGFFVHAYTGETFAYSGSTETGVAYLSSESLDMNAVPVRVALVPVREGKCEPNYLSYCKPVIGSSTSQMRRGEIGADFRFTVSPLHARSIVVTGEGTTGTMVEFEMFSEAYSKTYNELPTALSIPSDLNHIGYFAYAGATYAALPSDEGVILLDVTEGIKSAKEVTTEGTALSSTTGTAAVAGQVFVTKEGETITRGDIDLMLLRGDKATFLTTRGQKETTGMKQVAEEMGAVTYYTITGAQVSADDLTTGVYIRRQGNTATKVIIR